jgi:hypothetical protein
MKWWMLPWLFPLGLLATVVAVTVFRTNEDTVMLAGGALLVLLIGSIVFPPRDADGGDSETHYWRLRDWSRRG